MTRDTQLSRFKTVHGDKYDYSKSDFTSIKIKIICHDHGEFYQSKYVHGTGAGCPKCAQISRALTKQKRINDTFKEKLIKVHGYKYDYSKSEYESCSKKIKIYCKKCKKYFYMTYNNHVYGKGCPTCAFPRGGHLTFEELVIYFNETHGSKFIYCYTHDTRGKSYIKIYCKKCKKYFKQTIFLHKTGCGCRSCHERERKKHIHINAANTIIDKFKLEHGDKYDYTWFVYKTARNKSKIYCKECKTFFWQAAYVHLKHGCPTCKKSNGEESIITFLKSKGIDFKREYRFSDCKFKLPLPFDFYVPNYNLCIEYDGIQHFEPVQFGGCSIESANQNLIECIERDEIKNQYCKDNGIKLIRIPYTKFDNINIILKDNLNERVI